MSAGTKLHPYGTELYGLDVKTGDGTLPECVDCEAKAMPTDFICPGCGMPLCRACAEGVDACSECVARRGPPQRDPGDIG